MKKIKTKQKALATSADGNEKVSLPALLAIAAPLSTILTRPEICIQKTNVYV
jgi:hypothetical protein